VLGLTFLTFAAHGGFSLAAIYIASLTVTSPFGAVTVMFNAVFGALFFGENAKFNKTVYVGTFIIVGGLALALVGVATEEYEERRDELGEAPGSDIIDGWEQPYFLALFCTFTAVEILLLPFSHGMTPWMRNFRDAHPLFHLLSLAVPPGIQAVFSNSFIEQWFRLLDSEPLGDALWLAILLPFLIVPSCCIFFFFFSHVVVLNFIFSEIAALLFFLPFFKIVIFQFHLMAKVAGAARMTVGMSVYSAVIMAGTVIFSLTFLDTWYFFLFFQFNLLIKGYDSTRILLAWPCCRHVWCLAFIRLRYIFFIFFKFISFSNNQRTISSTK
jgi:hypothetical protein